MKTGIGFKLGFSFAVVMLVVGILALYTLHESQQSLEETVGNQSVFLAENLLQDINTNIFTIVENLQIEAQRPYIQEALAVTGSLAEDRGSVQVENISRNLVGRFFDYYERKYGYTAFEQIFLIDRQSKQVVQVGRSAHRHHFEESKWQEVQEKGFHVDRVAYQKDTGLWVIPVAVRINGRDGEMIGVLKATVLASVFFRSLSVRNSKYRSTQVHILTSRGQRLYSTQTYKLFEDLSSQPYFKAIGQKEGYFISSKGGKEKLFSYTHGTAYLSFKGFDWVLLVENDKAEVLAPVTRLRNHILLAIGGLLALIVLIGLIISRSITRPILALQEGVTIVGKGRLDHVIEQTSRDEIGDLCVAFNRMTRNLQLTDQRLSENQQEIERENWLKTGQADLNEQMQGNQDPKSLARSVISYLADYLGAETGAIYLLNNSQQLELLGGYAYNSSCDAYRYVNPGEGFIGQVALEKKRRVITDVPEPFFAIPVGTASLVPSSYAAFPILHEAELDGVVFLGCLQPFTENQLLFLERIMQSLSVAFFAARSRQVMADLLVETQRQSEELQTQQEELRVTNDGLEAQARALKKSESQLQEQQEELQQINEELQTQQEELKQSNEELEEKTEALEQRQTEVQKRNSDLKAARLQLIEKARDLEISNQYKSEFLANMSHELRTPLNSLLIFAQLLYENKGGNLTAKQVDFSQSIHSSGVELLNLINDILDLAKIESGKTELEVEEVGLVDISEYVQYYFRPQTEKKGVELDVTVAENLPAVIHTDRQKLNQILKNLLANAIKFTEKGSIKIRIDHPQTLPLKFIDLSPDQVLAISVTDTGIGVPLDKQKMIFEAFQQADGSTNRQYGGTGLGLSITRELTKLLQGEMQLESREGAGSTFTLLIPLHMTANQMEEGSGGDPPATEIPAAAIPVQLTMEPAENPGESIVSREVNPEEIPLSAIEDDRHDLLPDDQVILIVDDDLKFSRILQDMAHEKAFKCLLAHDGKTGLRLAETCHPSAIILDINLPGMDGWTVMERLKSNRETRAIPVHFISVLDKKLVGLKMGAIGFLTKPVSMDKIHQAFDKISYQINKSINHLLIVEDDENARNSLSALLSDRKNLQIHFAENAETALTILHSTPIDMMILDLRLPDMSGYEMLSRLEKESTSAIPPVIVYTGKEINQEEEAQLRRYAESIILKGVNSSERLLDEISLFLHRVGADLPAEQRNVFSRVHEQEEVLKDKQILLADDDMRNVYAIMELLEEKGMKLHVATNGQQALETLEKTPDIDLVLMDIMMPVMDGYEAIEKIRQQARWKKLPVIALTAKAMKGDREKCIEAGANDYLAKPIDVEKLFSLLRVWLYA